MVNFGVDLSKQTALSELQLKALDAANKLSDNTLKMMTEFKAITENMIKIQETMTKQNQVNTQTNNQILHSTLLEQQAGISDINTTHDNDSNRQTTNLENQIQTNLNNTLISLKNSIDKSNKNKLEIYRDYKLTGKLSFILWFDYLKSELKSKDLLDVIDPTSTTIANDLTISERVEKENLVRDIIINRINEYYHKQISHINDPRLIIQTLKENKRIENNISNTSVRQQLYSLKMKQKEKVSDFIEKFESIVRQNDNCEGAVKLTETEIRSSFYNAINSAVPEIRQSDIIFKQTNNKELTYQQLKNALLQIEADKRNQETQIKQTSALSTRTATQLRKDVIKCDRCAKYGHHINDCPVPKHLWFCYVCGKLGQHKGRFQCRQSPDYDPRQDPELSRYANQNFNKNYNKNRSDHRHNTNRYNTNRQYNTPKGRGSGKFRETQKNRADRRSKPYNVGNKTWTRTPAANQAGNIDKLTNNDNYITFIADSAATEHIIDKGFILSNFKKTYGQVIKSANKNRKADIQIDGKGNLLLKPDLNSDKLIELTNVIAAKNISNNLLSLRKFVDSGLSIYLDKEILIIYDEETNQEYITGKYIKPNWVIEVSAINTDFTNLNTDYENYTCTAQIVSLDEFLQQSQTDVTDLSQTISEGVNPQIISDNNPCEIGREIDAEIDQEETEFEDSDLNQNKINRKIHDLNKVNPEGISENMFYNQVIDSDLKLNKISEGMLWHIRLGHVSLGYLRQLQKNCPDLKNVKFEESIKDCEVCILSKMEKQPFKEIRSRAGKPLERIHSDLMGPIKPVSFPGENKYIITFIDDYSRFARIYTLKNKSQAGECLDKFLQNSRNMIGENKKVCFIRADNAKEYVHGEFLNIMNREKIDNNFAPEYTPELNGTSERLNKSLQWKIRSLMIDSGLPDTMWIFAAEAATHLYNRTPHKSNNFKIPLELFAPNLNLHIDKLRRMDALHISKSL